MPEALVWIVLIPALDTYDWLYARWQGLEPVGPVLSVDRRTHRGAERRFPDGTVLRRGDPVGELHLRNRRVLAIHPGARHPVALGLRFRRLLIASLRGLASHAATDPRLSDLAVFHARTILITGAARIGFVVGDDGNPAPFLRTLFFHLMLCRYHASGLTRMPAAMQAPRDLWLTAAVLRRRYGPAAPVRPG